MDLVNIRATTSTGENKGRVNKKHKNWHKRLHLRKTGVQPPAMQSQDKHGPKKITGEWEQPPAWPSSKNPPQEEVQSWHTTHSSGNTLRFACSQCKDNLEYVPKDLVRHFDEKHSGKPPVFSCHMCTFSTQEFSYLHVHLLSHSDSFSSCTMCNDNVQRSWLEFRAHMTMHHCSNGKYSCEMCQAFSTGDIHVFLQHLHGHSMELGEEEVELSQHNQDKDLLLTANTFRCRYCGFEASRKIQITKHVKAVHVCQNGNQWKVKPQDRLLRTKPRLTRSAVKGTCWLSQDCLSLPGREFLDKYCHLSDPKTTLEETEQFLMRSVTAETDDQKWTKALKSVLSNVPQDLHPKGENCLLLNPSDLTVLTVKNKITLAQNGAAYSKRLKMMASAEKDSILAGIGAGESECAATENGLRDQTACPEPERGPYSDILPSAQAKPDLMEPNNDNLELKSEELCEKLGERGIRTSSDLKLTDAKKKVVQKTQIIGRRQNSRRKRKIFRKAVKKSERWAVKMVLRKNPVKQRQWLPQEPLSASERNGEEQPQTPQALQSAEEHQTKVSTTEHLQSSEARMLVLPPEPEFSSLDAAQPGNEAEPQVFQKEPLVASDVEVGQSGPACSRGLKRAASMAEDQNVELQKNSICAAADGRSSAVCSAANTAEGVMEADVSLLQHSSEQTEKSAIRPEEASLLCLSAGKAIQQESSATSGWPHQPAPKHQERTLKLVAINPSQLVKRPSGDQPVVVLNHPDADIPQVVKIMEVVSRHREVQKVVLSRRTLEALSSSNHETAAEEARTGPAGPGDSPVQERFTLKFKFRRLNRKKFEIVGVDSPSRDFAVKFSCWFCGRIFTCQETMMSHRQRHLMEWKRPNCESS